MMTESTYEKHLSQIVSLLEKYGITEEDWNGLYTTLLQLGITDKAQITKSIYNYLTAKYPQHVALGVLTIIRVKYFDQLFDKAQFFEGYHMNTTAIQLFEELTKPKPKTEPKIAEIHPIEPDPTTIAHWLKGVKA